MVRVCFAEDCTRPHHVFGCVFHKEKAVYCDDCQHTRPRIFHSCSLRMVSPPAEDSTHGLCRECARLTKEHIRKHQRRAAGQTAGAHSDQSVNR